MYVPRHFAEGDPEILHGFIRAHSFGLLVTAQDGVPFATHLPFMLDADRGSNGTLVAHMARANPQWKSFDGTAEVLVVFSGPHAYVSPSWYDPAVDAVPTWNYAAVHAYGTPVVDDDPAAVRELLARLVAESEAGFAEPWRLESQADGYLDSMQKGIVAFDIPITRLEGKFKLNQNHGQANRAGAVAGLRDSDDPGAQAIAELMAAREKSR